MLTPRENFARFLKNEPYERIPTGLDCKYFAPTLISSNVSRGFVLQQNPFAGPMGGKDLLGVDWVFDPAARGSMEKRPLLDSPEMLKNWKEFIEFPNLDELDWEGCARENCQYLNTDKMLCTMLFSGFFERLISLVGFEDAAIALIDDEYEEAVHSLFDRLADLYIELIERMHRHFNVELFEVHDDWGTQISTLFSTETHKKMITPYVEKVIAGTHRIGAFYEQHSCGKIEDLVPAIIKSGADTWRGQNITDKKMLVGKYGDEFKFGIELRPAGPVDDETAAEMTRQLLEDFEGKHIWIAINRLFTPDQKKRIEEMIRAASVPERYRI